MHALVHKSAGTNYMAVALRTIVSLEAVEKWFYPSS
jgi:hypothetical protein